MKKTLLTTLLFGMVFFLFTGCGSSGEESLSGDHTGSQAQESLSSDPTDSQAQGSPSGNPAQGQEQGASNMQGVTQGDALYLNKYIPLKLAFPDSGDYYKTIRADSYGNRFYLLTEYKNMYDETDSWKLSLQMFDADTQQLEQLPFTLELPGRNDYIVVSIEVKSDSELSFRINESDGDDYHDFLVITDMEGNILSLEEDFPDGESYPWNAIYYWDSRMVFDNQDGSTILCEWDNDREVSTLSWFDKENLSRRPLGSLDGEELTSLYLEDCNTLYYTAGDSLIRWDMAANIRQRLCRISDIGVPSFPDYIGLLLSSEGEMLVCSVSDKKASVFVLSEEEPQSEEEIRFAYLREDYPKYSKNLATSFSNEHPNCRIKTENANTDASRDRLLIELATGKGPELMWVSKEDMKLLAEKDLLMDLSELIPADIYEQLFPCVIQDCTINGRMVGLAPYFDLQTMAVPNTVWEKDSWTLSDMLATAEARDDWELLLGNPYALDGHRIFLKMLPGLGGAPFLDLERGEAHFDHDDFRRLLELCLKYGGKTRAPGNEIYIGDETVNRLMLEGNCMAQLCYINWGFMDFSLICASFGNDIHITGFPSYNDSGHYMGSANGYLAVNKDARHLEEIREYIALFLDYESQRTGTVTGSCARRDVQWDNMISIQRESDLISDGTSYPDEYLDEYMAILESCVPWPENPSQVSAILEEELGAYFSENKSLEDTISIIQNRVQLYLDER